MLFKSAIQLFTTFLLAMGILLKNLIICWGKDLIFSNYVFDYMMRVTIFSMYLFCELLIHILY